MDDQRRFSAAPVNFDRFVSLNRSHSRSLSPDHELHQMLRPYQTRTLSTAVGSGHRKTTNASHSTKGERRSTDMLPATSGITVNVEGPATQAATPPSRSVSGGAATTTSTGASTTVMGHMERPMPPRYFSVEEETAELDCSPYVAEEVDPLLRAVQQLGSPLFDPMRHQFVCWKLHPLERRSRASYGDIEGVSCDFCGDTDWLDVLVDKGSVKKDSSYAGAPSQMKKEEEEGSSGQPDPPAHSRYLYHCSTCGVDICHACLAEVRADERFHVPCLQCQRCGACETRQDAPLHHCIATAHPKKEEVEKWLGESAEDEENSDDEVVPSWRSSSPSTMQPQPSKAAPALTETVGRKLFAGVPVRSHVRLGLSRRRGEATATVTVLDDEAPVTLAVQPVSPAPAAAIPPKASPRKRVNVSRGTVGGVKTRAKVEDAMPMDMDAERDLPVESMPPGRGHRTLSSYERQGTRPIPAVLSSSTSGVAHEVVLPSSVPSTTRYEVHITPHTSEEVDEVRRIMREQHLLLHPAPTVARLSVAYFPTRLAAESCVDRATVGSIEALVKRHIS